jgi:hypothetical protein
MRRLAPPAIAVLFMTGGTVACGSSSGPSGSTGASGSTAGSAPAGSGATEGSGNGASDVRVTKDAIK